MAHSVLVVDDRPEITRALTQMLEVDSRLSVAATASDGIEAVEYSKHRCPDAIILDVEMPRMDGLEALPLLRQSCPDCVIIIYSSDPDRAKAAPQLGADACVDKSEDPIALIDLVVDLCRVK
jgi:CheY-like chemotaxis protein